MILLDATTRKLQIVLAGAKTTNDSPWVASYVDIAQTGFAMQNANSATGNSNGVTAVDVVAAPGAGNTRQLKYFSLFNADTAPITVTVQFNDNATIRKMVTFILAVGASLFYNAETGWSVVTFPLVPTRQTLTATGTYTTPASCRLIKVRMIGGGGGGGSNAGGGNGGNTIFNSIIAGGGKADTTGGGGTGGSSAQVGSETRLRGFAGGTGSVYYASGTTIAGVGGDGGGMGGGSGGNASTGVAGAVNTGGGGGSGGFTATALGGVTLFGGGGSGEIVELIIANPAATYSFTIGAAGTAGAAAGINAAGGIGGTGIVIVDEFY